MDVDEEAPRSKARSAKRKRVNSVPSKGVSSRAVARSTKTSNTPIGSAAKKRKVLSSTVTEDESSATRVFALWRQDNHYYSGVVHSLSSTAPPRYLIHFDDGTEDVVEITKMRLCKLMKDDQVILVPGKQKAVVVDVSRFDSDRVVTVEIDNGEELDQLEIDAGDIKIASRTLASVWNNRTLVAEEVCPIVRPNALKNSPSPSKLTLGSAGSLKSVRRVLVKTGFVVTMSPKNAHWEKTKGKVMQAIKGSGGIVIDNWTDIFAMDGTYSQGGKRWVVRYEDIGCTVRHDIEQVFLLSDDCNTKPKYLIALALGIPCLDYNWILDTVGGRQEQDWQQYLLPAGSCEYLNARVSQFVDLDWGNSSEHLHAITENKVASKVFTVKRILCISPEYVPVAKARKNTSEVEKAKEASRMVPLIILTMGASSVEAVPEAKYASSKDLSEYDYVVVKDSGDIGRVASGANCVPFGWVKDCLIAGRLLPQPDD
ncbi:hypothetical protein DAEQUDRAFT_668140 [Daedalea quercina L-15889]|uniref:BRCT domain-containing protein n=1 Tax=Daedalea quercina L-15889 TaxID=1314783 RepID=A0A165R000_9APHY|nr:hypothetical protein DAEQUDRAFT_668140 [Daedalea quercina L-15889]